MNALKHGMGLVGLVVLVALLASFWVVSRETALYMDLKAQYLPPGPDHWLGTDQLGRDVFALFIVGMRELLWLGLAIVAVAMIVGVALGFLARRAGWIRILLNILAHIVFIAPSFLADLSWKSRILMTFLCVSLVVPGLIAILVGLFVFDMDLITAIGSVGSLFGVLVAHRIGLGDRTGALLGFLPALLVWIVCFVGSWWTSLSLYPSHLFVFDAFIKGIFPVLAREEQFWVWAVVFGGLPLLALFLFALGDRLASIGRRRASG